MDNFAHIIGLSLGVSLCATALETLVGLSLGAALAVYDFPGRRGLVVLANAFFGLPPVTVGLALYLLLSRSGPLGIFGLLFTPGAMTLAQAALATPIVTALAHRAVEDAWRQYGGALMIDGASRLRAIPHHPRRFRADHLRGWRHSHRGRQYRRVHPHHDDGDRARNQQRQFDPRSRSRPGPDRYQHHRERRHICARRRTEIVKGVSQITIRSTSSRLTSSRWRS
jgi:hypothetical protein